MKSRMLAVLMIPLAGLALAGCEAEQTQEGEMPAIEAEGGELPEYDVDAADVDVGTDTATVEVPTDIEVSPPDTGAAR